MKSIFLITFFLFISISSMHAGAVRVMPLGDSITYDDSYADQNNPRPASLRHAYRNYLWYKLRDAKYWVDFVGSRVAGTAITPHFDPENEGYPGQTTDFIGNHIYGFLANNPADIILLHIGTNDRWELGSDGSYMGGMYKIFNEIDRFEQNYHHHVKIILALIIGRRYNDYSSFTNNFNAHLNNLAHNRIAQGDDIYIVDMQHGAGLNYNSDFRDPAHPTTGGYSKMANLWYSALKQFLPAPTLTPVTNLVASSLTEDSVKLNWTDNTNNELGFRLYHNNTLIATINSNVTSYTLNNLTPDTTYTYKIVVYNANGTSSPTYITLKTNKAPIPEKPTQGTSLKVDKYSATLTWKDNSKYEKGFKIYRDSVLIATVPVNTTSYKLSSLISRETYTYNIVSYNDAGISSSISITFTTKDDYGWLPAVYHTILY